MVRACGSYPQCPGFNSLRRHHSPVRLVIENGANAIFCFHSYCATFCLNGKRAITADTAIRLGRYLGTSPEVWMGLQADYSFASHSAQSGLKWRNEFNAALHSGQ